MVALESTAKRMVDLDVIERSLRAQRTAPMKVDELRAVLPPAEVSEDALLPDGAGEPLDGRTSMLVLPRINDRLRPEPT